jgi:hypothetical protein
MTTTPCPKCGHPVTDEAAACAHCGQALANGAMPQAINPARKPTPPAEVSGWTMDRTPPDLREWARQTFSEEEFAQQVREIEQTGGVKFEDFIGEIEERVKRRD